MFQGYLTAILGGLGWTLGVATVSLALSCVFGLLGTLGKLSASRLAIGLVIGLAGVYTTALRGVPKLVLVLMLGLFYGGQILLNDLADARGWGPFDLPPFLAGTLTLGFIFGAYLTETFRGAILAVPRGQTDAAAACGFSRAQALRRILLPQMVRHAIPRFANNGLVMLKATALVSINGLDDLVHRANMAASATREPLTFFVLTAAVYLAITTASASASVSVSVLALSWLEKRYSLGVKALRL